MAFCGACYTKNCHVTVNGGTGQCPSLSCTFAARAYRGLFPGVFYFRDLPGPCSQLARAVLLLAPHAISRQCGWHISSRSTPWGSTSRATCVLPFTRLLHISWRLTLSLTSATRPSRSCTGCRERWVWPIHDTYRGCRLPLRASKPAGWHKHQVRGGRNQRSQPRRLVGCRQRDWDVRGLLGPRGRPVEDGKGRHHIHPQGVSTVDWKRSPPRRYTVHFFSSSFVYHTQSPMSSPVSSTNLNFRTLNSNCHFSGSILLWMRLHAGVRLRSG
jgi:hypothetical protein